MAAANYCLCWRCGAKAFYDAEVTDERYLNAFDAQRGVECIGIKVLCVECNKTHTVVIRGRELDDPIN